jgi:DNA-binding GntR family transcriptional regulator
LVEVKERASSLTQSCYERLKADLISCRLKPGERLRTQDLCVRLDANLSAVREALSRLTSEDLVVAEPQRGFRAAPISFEELQDLSEARADIEALCVRRSIALGGIEWETRLVAAHHQLSQTPIFGSGDETAASDLFGPRNAEFHAALAAACDNQWLLRVRELLQIHAQRYINLSLAAARGRRDVDAEHRQIFDAALSRDTERAVKLVREHLARTAELIIASEFRAK